MWATTTAVMMAMTVSDQRREEIVRELRYISGNPPEWATSASVVAEFLDVDYPVKWRDSGELFSMLADLIERGTCRNEDCSGRSFFCSACGYEAWTYDDSCCDPSDFSFCPDCGRKVVREDGRHA